MRGLLLSRCGFLAVAVLGLSGCSHLQAPDWQWPWHKAPQVVAAPAPVAAPQVRVETPEELALRMLLLNGEYTLMQNQLLTPANDNAYMYFAKALALDPDNARAKGGMQGIVMRYVDLARQAAARENYGAAKAHLDSARKVDPRNLLIKEVDEGLRAQMAASPKIEPYKGGRDEYLLDHAHLGTDNPALKATLAEVATRVKKEDALAMIVARTDVEGRWIYQQMRAAVPGYLVRGDIQLGSPARVKIVPRM